MTRPPLAPRAGEQYVCCPYRQWYQIESVGRLYLVGRNVTPGVRPYKDKIWINRISSGWRVGEVVEFAGWHHEWVTPYGRRVLLEPWPLS